MHNQHFLLEAQARKISLPEVAEWDDETVRATFQELRWPETDGDPVCRRCGCIWGQVHQICARKLYLYANEITYREDARKWDNRRTAFDMLVRMLTCEDDDKKPRSGATGATTGFARATMTGDVRGLIGMPPSYDGGMLHFNTGFVRLLHNAVETHKAPL